MMGHHRDTTRIRQYGIPVVSLLSNEASSAVWRVYICTTVRSQSQAAISRACSGGDRSRLLSRLIETSAVSMVSIELAIANVNQGSKNMAEVLPL
jgi:hypothetical protein